MAPNMKHTEVPQPLDKAFILCLLHTGHLPSLFLEDLFPFFGSPQLLLLLGMIGHYCLGLNSKVTISKRPSLTALTKTCLLSLILCLIHLFLSS